MIDEDDAALLRVLKGGLVVWVDIHPNHPRVHSGPECTRGWFRVVPWVVWVDTEWISWVSNALGAWSEWFGVHSRGGRGWMRVHSPAECTH